jgi:hypothetical protein
MMNRKESKFREALRVYESPDEKDSLLSDFFWFGMICVVAVWLVLVCIKIYGWVSALF